MKTRCVILAASLCLAAGSVALAVDTIKTETAGTLRGNITAMSPVKVEVELITLGGLVKKIPVNEIVWISYGDEPSSLRNARDHIRAGRLEDALSALEKINPADIQRDVVAQDLQYYRALAASQLALQGRGEVLAAAKQMAKFLADHSDSYHFLEATQTMGDLALAEGRYARAEGYYSTLAKAPWDVYKMRAAVAVGRARFAQKKFSAARQAFDAALAMKVDGGLAKAQRIAATLGKADCLAAESNPDQAVTIIQDVLAKTDPEDAELQARAYNSLGSAYRKAGRNQDALLAFLHVDVLYYTVPDAHAEALANLAQLWKKLHRTERATRARQILEQRYGKSPWAKQGQ